MRSAAQSGFAIFAGVAMGTLSSFLTLTWIAAEDDGVGGVFAALILTPIVFCEVTGGAVASLLLLANERRRGAALVAVALVLVLVGEYAWLTA